MQSILTYTYTARSETGNHDAMLEDLVFIARFPLAYPKMMCPKAVCEILVKPGLFLRRSILVRSSASLHEKRIVFIIIKYRFITSSQ